MADTSLLLEKSSSLIQQATLFDRNKQYSEALRLYLNGLDGFISALKLEKNDRVKQTLRLKMEEYMNRAEQLKDLIKKGYVSPPSQQPCHDCITPPTHTTTTTLPSAPPQRTSSIPPQYHPIPTNTDDLILPSVPSFNPPPPPYNPSATNIPTTSTSNTSSSSSSNNISLIVSKKIANGSIGNSYETLFGEYLIGCTSIKIEDPYIRSRHQIDNFIKLVELIITKCIYKELSSSSSSSSVSTTGSIIPNKPINKFKIDLITSTESKQQEDELKLTFYQIKDMLSTQFNIQFNYQFSNVIHDRIIETSNGYQIKLGRGLDFYQKPLLSPGSSGLFSPISTFNQNLRPCLETSIDIFILKK